MSSSRLIAVLSVALSLGNPVLAGCTPTTAEESDAEGAAAAISSDRTLNETECKSVSLENRETAEGTFDGPLRGCVVGGPGETGDALVERVVAIVGDERRLAEMRKPDGKPMWTRFETSRRSGSLAPGDRLAFDAKIGLDIIGPFDAKGTVRFVIERRSEGRLTISIRNETGIGAAGATAIAPGALDIALEITPARNGILVSGNVAVTLSRFQSHAPAVSRLGPQIVQWLDRELGTN